MKEVITQFAQYNSWANKIIGDNILKLEERLWEQEIVSSFPSIKSTIVHIWSAEYIWLQRLQLVEYPEWVQNSFTGSLDVAIANWERTSEDLLKFTEQQPNDQAFQHILAYYDREKQHHKMPVFKVLMHIYNHSSTHRGQLFTMLRQVGETKIPHTDFIIFSKK